MLKVLFLTIGGVVSYYCFVKSCSRFRWLIGGLLDIILGSLIMEMEQRKTAWVVPYQKK